MKEIIEVQLPKTVARIRVVKDDLVVLVLKYKNGNAETFSGQFSYSQVGNMNSAGLSPVFSKVMHALSLTSSMYSGTLDTDTVHAVASELSKKITTSDGPVTNYFNSFQTAKYDPVKDSWKRTS